MTPHGYNTQDVGAYAAGFTWRATCAWCGAVAQGTDGQGWTHYCPTVATSPVPLLPAIHVERFPTSVVE